MSKNRVRKYIAIVAGISLGISILVHFNTILGVVAPAGINISWDRSTVNIPQVIVEVFVTFLVAFSLFVLNYFVLRPINGSRRLNIRIVLFSILITIIAVTILSEALFALKHLIFDTSRSSQFNLLYTFRDLFIAIIVLSTVFIIRNINEKQIIRFENEKLIRENLQSQYESLKNQVSPHFLFNSLTALKTLISDDPKKAMLYLNDLSQVLRYTLQSNENQTVSLYDEMEAAKSYMFLIKTRFNTNLNIVIQIQERYNHYRLPPLAIQTLLENAVKHNEISKRHPLDITIRSTENDSLLVTNTLQEKLSMEPGTGIGLSNLSTQYKLLSGLDIGISRTADLFRVEIPLLKPTSDEDSNR